MKLFFDSLFVPPSLLFIASVFSRTTSLIPSFFCYSVTRRSSWPHLCNGSKGT
jgi:hypothetical protein